MPEIDHIIFASPDLEEGIDCIEQLTGARPVIGGPHPGVGTHNALLTFDDVTYFEVIAIDPDQPEPGRARPFGLMAGRPPVLAGFAIHPIAGESLEQVAGAMRSAGFDPGQVMSMSRVKPDGEEIHWQLTSAGATSPADGVLPFVIDWGETPSPALSLPSMGSLESLTVRHPDARVREAAAAVDVGVRIEDGDPGLVAVVLTANGRVELS